MKKKEQFSSLRSLLFAASGALAAELLLSSSQSLLVASFARITIVTFSLYILHRFALTAFRTFRPSWNDTITLLATLLVSVAMLAFGNIIGKSLTIYLQSYPPFADGHAHSFAYGIPFAAGALLIQALLGFRYGLVIGLSIAVIVALYTPEHPAFVVYTLSTMLVGCLSLTSFRSRSAYLVAGLQVSLSAVPFALASSFIDSDVSGADVAIRFIGALFLGVQSAMIAAGLVPLIEMVGKYVTDLRLIEMATLDHPLLKELSIVCPGTWNHSMIMGMMSESAASEIGANPVIARVGAYFHDIGKIKKPMYFIENQRDEENRHEKLSSSMSALIIRSHVKDGIELGEQHKLPQCIVDFIPQHHGTSRIEYFYDKACREAEESGEDPALVDSTLYSYPGPRPQTKEAGILMLADGIEASTRTLSDPSFDRIQGLVQKMINKVFSSGELDECELTLKDLHAIAKAFTRTLSGIYHQRIAYADNPEKEIENLHRLGIE